jgi:tRNA pseudouridine32 synthase/23S rRNA pseudouridine746 synthase
LSIDYRPPPDTGLDILYQDDRLIAVNKPPDLLSVPGRGEHHQDSLASRVQQRLPHARVVHRLDMSTSGIMLMALDGDSLRAMNRLFSERRVSKSYTAVVAGHLQTEHGEIRLPLICDWPNRPRQKVDHTQGKQALTEYRVLARADDHSTTRVELIPVTGRTHQLRVHMQSQGHSILGDKLYAGAHIQKMARRLLLHATRLSFRHPFSGETVDCYSPVPF